MKDPGVRSLLCEGQVLVMYTNRPALVPPPYRDYFPLICSLEGICLLLYFCLKYLKYSILFSEKMFDAML